MEFYAEFDRNSYFNGLNTTNYVCIFRKVKFDISDVTLEGTLLEA